VSLGAATDGVTYFSFKKLTTFLVIAFCKVITFLAVLSSQLPPSSDVVCQVFFLNSATKINFIRVSPHGWCHAGQSALSPPPSDATAYSFKAISVNSLSA